MKVGIFLGSIVTLLILIIAFGLFGYLRLVTQKDAIKDVPAAERYKGLALYAFVYGLGIYLAYTISGMVSKQMESNLAQWGILLATLIVVIIVIIQTLHKLLPEQLRKVFL